MIRVGRSVMVHARRQWEGAFCLALLVATILTSSGCAKRAAQGQPSSPLVGNWETRGLTGAKKVFYLSQGGTGVVDTLGDSMKPDLIMSWAYDGANFTYTTQKIDYPNAEPVTRTYRCVLSSDGSSFRILLGDKGFDADPVSKAITTYYRTAATPAAFIPMSR